ncbi:MAG: YezD family protein [Patescibacteria group bacterium]|nr:YezD family protein [Patescibacteria group bacterium]
MSYPLKKDSSKLLGEIEKALDGVIFGSVEIYVQDGKVVQISKRSIQKTNITITDQSLTQGTQTTSAQQIVQSTIRNRINIKTKS